MRSAPNTMSGRSARALRRRSAIASARRVAALHALQDQVVAGLQRQMQMRHQPLFLGERAHQSRHRPRSNRARRCAAAAVRARGAGSARTSAPSFGVPGRSGPIGGEIDAGQHDFAIAALDQARGSARPLRPIGDRARGAAAVGNDAEGAAVVAAVLHLHEGAGAAFKAVDQMQRGVAHRREIVDLTTFPRRRAEIEGALQVDPGRRRAFRRLPSTRSTSGIAAKVSGSVCAAQPVTMIARPGARASGGGWSGAPGRTASAVTAQELTMIVSSSPAASALRRITSDSAALSRQPKVTTSTHRVPHAARQHGSSRACPRTRVSTGPVIST